MPASNFDSIAVTSPISAANISAGVSLQARSHVMPTIPTAAGATEVLFRAPCTGTVAAASFVAKDALVQHATNIVTVSIRNYGQAGAGNVAVLAAVDANTTKTSTGFPLLAYTPFPLTLNATPANLAVVKGDILAFIVTGSGTLANTITEGVAVIDFAPS